MGNFQAMRAEMNEDYDKAAKILDSILDEDESNNQAKKRKIAMLKVKQFSQTSMYSGNLNTGNFRISDIFVSDVQLVKSAQNI